MTFNLKKLVGYSVFAVSLSFGNIVLAAGETTTTAETEKTYTLPLYKPGKIADHILGNPDAKVTIVEYASLTCPHCENFHTNTFKKFKTNYIDTGKVKFIYRNFHLDNVALAGAMLAECAPADQYYSIVDLIFSTQGKWLRVQPPFPELVKTLKLAGYSDEKVNECFAKKQQVSDMIDDRSRAESEFGVRSTPTLFINGVKLETSFAYDNFTKVVEEALAE